MEVPLRTRDALLGRTARLDGVMAEVDVDVLLVTDLASVRWLTGFTGTGRVLVRRGHPPLLVTDARYEARAAAECPTAEVQLDRTWGWLGELAPPKLAVEAEWISWAQVRELEELLEDTELVATERVLSTLRATKDTVEVEALQRACEVTARAFDDALGWLAPGLTEREVARRLVDTMLDMGADAAAFPPIVAAGPNGATPHHDPGDRPLQAGELVTMDFGARVDGYHADMTRTVALGQPSLELQRIHDLVRTAQQAGVETVADGVDTQAVDAACRDVITQAGHGEHFVHGTGHGVGLAIHEEPFLGTSTTATLRSQMTVTVEPGVYLPGVGGVRIEDVVLVDGDRGRRLTDAPHDLFRL